MSWNKWRLQKWTRVVPKRIDVSKNPLRERYAWLNLWPWNTFYSLPPYEHGSSITGMYVRCGIDNMLEMLHIRGERKMIDPNAVNNSLISLTLPLGKMLLLMSVLLLFLTSIQFIKSWLRHPAAYGRRCYWMCWAKNKLKALLYCLPPISWKWMTITSISGTD